MPPVGGADHRGALRALRTALAGAAAAVVAWGSVSLLFEPNSLAVSSALLVGAAVPLYSLRAARRRRLLECERRDLRRIFWSVSEDFDGDGWARRDLNELAFLCANLDHRCSPGSRLESRLFRSIDAVRFGVVDRLYDLTTAAAMNRLDEGVVDRLERAAARLARSLPADGGHAFIAPPRDVARAAREALSSAERLRADLCSSAGSDAGALVAWLVRSRKERRVATREAALTIRGGALQTRVRVPSMPLTTTLDRFLGFVERRSVDDGKLELDLSSEAEGVVLSVSCTPRRGAYGPAAMILEPLMGYGVTLRVDDGRGARDEGFLTYEITLPREASAAADRARTSSGRQDVSEVFEASSYFTRAGSGGSERFDVSQGTSTDR